MPLYPLPPKNVMAMSPFLKNGALDIRWDDPSQIGENTTYNVVGVNVYRSDASDRGPFRRLNSYPVSGTFFRDFTDLVLVNQEVILWDQWQSKGDAPNAARWTLCTRYPIVKPHTLGTPADSPDDVLVTIDGVPAWVGAVFGQTNSVTLNTEVALDPRNIRGVAAPLPTPTSAVAVTYYTPRNVIFPATLIDRKIHYRITTVVLDASAPGGLSETPLDQTMPVSAMQIEQLDYIWREAMRRNRWILEQGGERVKLFVQKINGMPCMCTREIDPRTRAYSKQPSQRCVVCYGTGYVGGFEGPYDTIIAPDDAEKRIAQTPTGRTKQHLYEVWMTNTPVVSQRDFILKQDGDRYSIGPVRRPTNRGNVMQQHFNIGYIDPNDIRYQVPIEPSMASPNLPWPQTRYTYQPYRETYDKRTDAPWPVAPDAVLPLGTEEVNSLGAERFRTATGENHSDQNDP